LDFKTLNLIIISQTLILLLELNVRNVEREGAGIILFQNFR